MIMLQYLLIFSLCLILAQVSHAERNPIHVFIDEQASTKKLSQEKMAEFEEILERHRDKINDRFDGFSGDTPLIFASLFQSKQIVKKLLHYGANTDLKNRDGDTALHTAGKYCSYDIVELLTTAGADISIRNCGQTALDWANRKPWWECYRTRRLLKYLSDQLPALDEPSITVFTDRPLFYSVMRMPSTAVKQPVLIDDSSLVQFADVGENEDCLICKEDFKAASIIRECNTCKGTYYHDKCIRWWLEKSQSCPTCRQKGRFRKSLELQENHQYIASLPGLSEYLES